MDPVTTNTFWAAFCMEDCKTITIYPLGLFGNQPRRFYEEFYEF